MRADRLLSILLLLQTHGRLTSRALAARLEVSERTVHRDMEALSAAGIPVVAERGLGGGWTLPDDYRTNLTGLTDAEIQALFLGQPDRLLSDLGLAKAADAAQIKLLAALPKYARRDAEDIRQRIHVDIAGWHSPDEDSPALPALQEAIWQERKVRLAYRRTDGVTVERLVDPLGLVAKGRVWYLVAAVEGEPRTYRVSRVQAVQLTDEPCVRPPGFDLAAYWEQSVVQLKAGLPRYPARLRAKTSVRDQLRNRPYARIEAESPPDSEGWRILDVQFEVEDDACAQVLSFGPEVEVLEPPALREKVAQLAEAIVARYRLGLEPEAASRSPEPLPLADAPARVERPVSS